MEIKGLLFSQGVSEFLLYHRAPCLKENTACAFLLCVAWMQLGSGRYGENEMSQYS